jgi:hypothetical protein
MDQGPMLIASNMFQGFFFICFSHFFNFQKKNKLLFLYIMASMD